jgi:TM2 domain-containing membrane protein YozV
MAEFGVMEQQYIMSGLTDQQKILFQAQYASEKKDRTMVLILSVLFGYWGVDRFMLGDMGMGLLKLFTGGVCGILWLIDIFTIQSKADDYNRQKAAEIVGAIRLNSPSGVV